MKHLLLAPLFLLLGGGLFAQGGPVPEDTEVWEPVPEQITPGEGTAPPSDAIVLFDGENLDQWRKPQFLREVATIQAIEEQFQKSFDDFAQQPADWTVEDGQIIVKPGSGAIETKMPFGDIQLHIEWLAPTAEDKQGQGYSNSGVFLMGLYEIQVLNSFENPTYVNGQAGSVYKQTPPMVNASRQPGLWQSYDIFFFAPEFDEDGGVAKPAMVTVIHNGVLIQHAVELQGPTAYVGESSYLPHEAERRLRLQDHGDPMRFRNIWVRKL
ncbi:MAG: DUF1080 domain-containing protein [Bacteroidota bacterium]